MATLAAEKPYLSSGGGGWRCLSSLVGKNTEDFNCLLGKKTGVADGFVISMDMNEN